MTASVHIKWGKELYKDVVVNLSGTAADFRQQLFSLTNVAPENQKVMGKGVTLKDTDWEGFKKALVPNATLMMMGTPSKVIQEVTEAPKTVFMEDLPEDAQLAAAENLAPGLQNLGNTCYMNASLQMMNAMTELRAPLDQFKPAPANADPEAKLTVAMKNLVGELRSQKTTIMPFSFLGQLRTVYPRFAEQQGGRYVQQSADECWVSLVQAFKRLPIVATEPMADGDSGIEQLVQGEMLHETTPVKPEEDTPTKKKETFEVLNCHIDIKVDFLFQGVNLALNSTITKRSPVTNADAEYVEKYRINRLPYYLVVQFLRFQWRPGAKDRSKIVRPVEFPMDFDAHEFCSDDLKNELKEKREEVRIRNDKPAAEKTPVKQDPLRNQTGFYELAAVVTHLGRDCDGGHYVAWVRQEGDRWLLFDDDKVSPATPDDIKKLSGKGGADWHIAYMCLYRTKQFN